MEMCGYVRFLYRDSGYVENVYDHQRHTKLICNQNALAQSLYSRGSFLRHPSLLFGFLDFLDSPLTVICEFAAPALESFLNCYAFCLSSSFPPFHLMVYIS